MKTYKIDDLMVPLTEYATVTVGATLFDAVLALEKAQEEFDQTKYRHRAILVLDQQGEVVGKISQHTALKALEPQYMKMAASSSASHYGFSVSFLKDFTGPVQPFGRRPGKHLPESRPNQGRGLHVQVQRR